MAKAQSVTEDAKNAIDLKMVPSKVETGQPALPQAFKEAPVPGAEAAQAAPAATPEPTKRAKKAEPAPAPAKDVSAILDQWADDGDD